MDLTLYQNESLLEFNHKSGIISLFLEFEDIYKNLKNQTVVRNSTKNVNDYSMYIQF